MGTASGWAAYSKSAAKPGQPQIAVSDGLAALGMGSAEFAAGNPHFWLSAALGARYVRQIRDRMIGGVDPASQASYTRMRGLRRQHRRPERRAEAACGEPTGSSAQIVTDHDAFAYFAQGTASRSSAPSQGNSEAEPSAGKLAELVAQIRAEQVKAPYSRDRSLAQKLTETIGA
ncbi:MAG: metal ABC transporter substrate-binding protein [Kouleothrix sp.]